MEGCLYPILIQPTDLSALVACGQCTRCRIRRKAAWVGRMCLEHGDHKHARFLTLTYAEDPGELNPHDLRDYLKRYRYHYGKFRFFAVGEYGGKTGRGHWHIIMYGQKPSVVGHLKGHKPWDAGYVYDGYVSQRSIGYVGGYVLKRPLGVHYSPVSRQSLKPGIGLARIGKMAVRAANERLEAWPSWYTCGGRRYPLAGGGLLHFQQCYLESGGVPPPLTTPEERDMIARVQVSDWGTRIPQGRTCELRSRREVCDAWALPQEKAQPQKLLASKPSTRVR